MRADPGDRVPVESTTPSDAADDAVDLADLRGRPRSIHAADRLGRADALLARERGDDPVDLRRQRRQLVEQAVHPALGALDAVDDAVDAFGRHRDPLHQLRDALGQRRHRGDGGDDRGRVDGRAGPQRAAGDVDRDADVVRTSVTGRDERRQQRRQRRCRDGAASPRLEYPMQPAPHEPRCALTSPCVPLILPRADPSAEPAPPPRGARSARRSR